MNATRVYLVKRKLNKFWGYLACLIVGVISGLVINFGNGKTAPASVSEFHAKSDSAANVTVVLKQKDKVISARIEKKEAGIQGKIDSVASLSDSAQVVAFTSNFCDTISGDSIVLVSVSSIRKANIAFVELEATKSLLLDVRYGYENRGKIIESQEDEIINLRGENQALVEDLEREKKKVKVWKYVAAGALILGIAL